MKMRDYVLTVTQTNEYVRGLLSRDPLLKRVAVQGEISGFKRHASGHLYFSLKDEGALIRCVMFRQNALTLSFRPLDGMHVIVDGSVSLFTRDGQYQLYAEFMSAAGEGELYRQFILLKERLEKEGLFEESRKRPIPALPRAVGIATSGGGAALHDIITVIRRRFPSMDILFCACAVQGPQAPAEIVRAIKRLNEAKRADVLIVGRGGGSIEDLYAFNDTAVARAIFESEAPVISAVGHETDFTIADFVSDLRAPTPSAAAEMAVPDFSSLSRRLSSALKALEHNARAEVQARRDKVQSILRSAAFSKPAQRLELYRKELGMTEFCMLRDVENTLNANKEQAKRFTACLDAANPSRILGAGYALVRDARSHQLKKSTLELDKGSVVEIVLSDGSVSATIDDAMRSIY